MTTIKEWLTATGRDVDQHLTTARGKLTDAHRAASERVKPVANRAAKNVSGAYQAAKPLANRAVKNVGSAYQAAQPRVKAAVVYAAPHVKHGVKYAAIRALRLAVKAERQFLDYVDAHLPKEDEVRPALPKPSPVEPAERVTLPQAKITVADVKNEDDGGNGLDPSGVSRLPTARRGSEEKGTG
jgi:hypothetical protein